jgi:hypothetical protein
VPFDDLEAFEEWVTREDPPYSTAVAIKDWIEGLGEAPWQSPRAPIDEMSVEGEFQTRHVLFGGDVIYQEHYATGTITVIDIRKHASDFDG